MLGRDKLDELTALAYTTAEEENEETAYVGVAMIVMEVSRPDGGTAFYTFCSDKREWIQRALVREAGEAIEYSEVENGDA